MEEDKVTEQEKTGNRKKGEKRERDSKANSNFPKKQLTMSCSHEQETRC